MVLDRVNQYRLIIILLLFESRSNAIEPNTRFIEYVLLLLALLSQLHIILSRSRSDALYLFECLQRHDFPLSFGTDLVDSLEHGLAFVDDEALALADVVRAAPRTLPVAEVVEGLLEVPREEHGRVSFGVRAEGDSVLLLGDLRADVQRERLDVRAGPWVALVREVRAVGFGLEDVGLRLQLVLDRVLFCGVRLVGAEDVLQVVLDLLLDGQRLRRRVAGALSQAAERYRGRVLKDERVVRVVQTWAWGLGWWKLRILGNC